ncbi:MAG TPA: hypothetical protein VNG71_05350 [Pyrinomonadaceae bacterium]|nr:hypothetical protein [Pyrinomonadaceae bacterium]
MKRTIKLLALAAALAVFAVPALAQNDQCTDENKDLWYAKTFLPNFKGDAAQQKLAYDAAMKYINACGLDDQYAKYMKRVLVDPVDANAKTADIGKLFDAAVKGNKYAEQMRLGKQLLEKDPDNVDLNVILGIAGLGDASLLNEAATYATKAISLIESGKTPKVYTKDQALAQLDWTIARSKLTSAPADAITDLLKAAKIESEVKKNPALYVDLAAAYANGSRQKLTAEYQASLKPDKTETDQSKVILENLNRVIDNQIDAMARAAALTPDATKKKELITDLAVDYKYRNKAATDANVTELVAKVLSTPIPDVPTPVTSVPGPSPSSTPATNGNGSNGTPANGGANNGTKPTGSVTNNTSTTGKGTTGTGTSTPAGTAKPTATPTPQRKPLKFRRN